MSIFVDHKALKHLLRKLKDVEIVNPTDGEALVYEALTELWKNKPAPGLGNALKGCRDAMLAETQSIPNNTWTTVNIDTEYYDDLNEFDLVNHRFVPSTTGRYLIVGAIRWTNTPDGCPTGIGIFVGAVAVGAYFYRQGSAGVFSNIVTAVVQLTAGQLVTLRAWQNSGAAQTIDTGSALCYIAVVHLTP